MTREQANDCTVLVASCDPYADLHDPFITLFRKHWPDCPWPVVLLTETVCAAANGAGTAGFDRVVKTGPGKCWSAMMAEALRAIETPYVILLMDDYLLSRRVDTARMVERLREARSLNAANLRLSPDPRGGTPYPGTDLFEYRKNTAYCVSCKAGFWARDYLLGLVERTKSAWEFEREGSFMVGDETRPILHTPTPEFPFVDAVHKGYWETFGVRVLRDNAIAVDFTRRGLPPLKARLAEGLKDFVFRLVPTTLLVRVQNALHIGARERRRPISP